ncbi:MAG TPA: L,D-transpeptidase [Solirubrobacteraceae bacterium]|nr:L,D-transpeptidase [Solirubrobacteraceae bacterium]
MALALGAGIAVPGGAIAAASPAAPVSEAPAPAGAPSATPAAGALRLSVSGAGGTPRFALLGRRITIRGSVTPYVAGQQVQLSFDLDGRAAGVRVAGVLPGPHGTGRFAVAFASRYGGLLRVRAAHAASAQQAAFAASAPELRYVDPNVGFGARGQSVRLLQSELSALHYAVPLSGVFDEATGRALVAYRKVTGLERVAAAGARVFELLARGAGAFHVRYPGDGRHVEADLAEQVLAEIEPGGRVYRIYTTSSGKPSTPTVLGRFRVYLKTPGENSEGMVDSNYFIRGYAIHGYAEVPTYAASHGCLRVPIPDAPAIYAWVREGTPVDVYE